MWLRLRNTASRGRVSVPAMWRRMRSWRLRRASPRLASFVMLFVPSLSRRLAEKPWRRWPPSHPQSRPIGCARFGRSPPPCPDSPSRRVWPLLLAADLAGLARLSAHALTGVAHALALVWLGLAAGADGRGDLSDELLVDPDDREASRVLELERDARGRLDLDRVAVAEAQLELAADERGTVADARDLESLPVARRDARDHVVHERPGEAVQLLVMLLLGGSGDDHAIVLTREEHVRMELARELPLGTLDRQTATVDRHLDPGRDCDWQATDT